MPANRTRTFHLTIKLKKFTRKERKFAKFGYIDPKSATRHVIWINTEFPLLDTIGTLYHEFSHWLFYSVFKDNTIVPEKQEHEFCSKMDKDSKKNFKLCLGDNIGEEDDDE